MMDVMSEQPAAGLKRKSRNSFRTGRRTKKIVPELSVAELERLEKKVLGDSSTFKKNLEVLEKFTTDLVQEEKLPAWQDEEDLSITISEALSNCRHKPLINPVEGKTYKTFLEQKFNSTLGTPKWASRFGKKENKNGGIELDSSDEEDSDRLLKRCGPVIDKTYTREQLTKSILDIKRLAALNCETRNEGPIVTSVEFHPTSTVSLVAGTSGVASVFQVDGRGNNKLASVHFKDFPIKCAKFSSDGNQMILGSNLHSHFYVYDLMEGRNLKIHLQERNNLKRFEVSRDGKWLAACGRFGDILLLSAISKEQVATLHISGMVTSVCFSPDSSVLYAFGEAGNIWAFDVSERKCMGYAPDSGWIGMGEGVVVASKSLLATGSPSGVVNLYSRSSSSPLPLPPHRPIKALMNLVTPITALSIDPTEQILASASYHKEQAIKLFHIESLTTFSNFPQQNSNLKRVQAVAFSPSSGYMAVTNNNSSAFLYRLKHFGDY